MFDKTAVVLLVRIVSSLHDGIWHELKMKLRYENQFDYEPSQFYLKKKKNHWSEEASNDFLIITSCFHLLWLLRVVFKICLLKMYITLLCCLCVWIFIVEANQRTCPTPSEVEMPPILSGNLFKVFTY